MMMRVGETPYCWDSEERPHFRRQQQTPLLPCWRTASGEHQPTKKVKVWKVCCLRPQHAQEGAQSFTPTILLRASEGIRVQPPKESPQGSGKAKAFRNTAGRRRSIDEIKSSLVDIRKRASGANITSILKNTPVGINLNEFSACLETRLIPVEAYKLLKFIGDLGRCNTARCSQPAARTAPPPPLPTTIIAATAAATRRTQRRDFHLLPPCHTVHNRFVDGCLQVELERRHALRTVHSQQSKKRETGCWYDSTDMSSWMRL